MTISGGGVERGIRHGAAESAHTVTTPALDHSVAALRALLTGDFDTFRRLHAELRPAGNVAFSVALTSAFIHAVDQHFGESPSPADVINFVAEARARYQTTAQRETADDAEQAIRTALGEDRLFNGMSGRAIGAAQTAMLFALVQEDGLSPSGIDTLLARAAEKADEYFRRRGR